METIEVQFQRPDFTTGEARLVAPQQAIQAVVNHPWRTKLAELAQRLADKQEACSPTVFLTKPDGTRMSVFVNDADEFCGQVELPIAGHELVGVIARPKWQEVKFLRTDVQDLVPIVTLFVQTPSKKLAQALGKHQA